MIIVAWNGLGEPSSIFSGDVFKKVLSVFITAAILAVSSMKMSSSSISKTIQVSLDKTWLLSEDKRERMEARCRFRIRLRNSDEIFKLMNGGIYIHFYWLEEMMYRIQETLKRVIDQRGENRKEKLQEETLIAWCAICMATFRATCYLLFPHLRLKPYFVNNLQILVFK